MAWYRESGRHSKAAKGIKTGRKGPSPKLAFRSRVHHSPKLYEFHFAIGLKHGYTKAKEKISPLLLARSVANTTGFGFNIKPQRYIEKGYEEKSIEFTRSGMTLPQIRKVEAQIPFIGRKFHQEEIFEEVVPLKEMRFIKSAEGGM